MFIFLYIFSIPLHKLYVKFLQVHAKHLKAIDLKSGWEISYKHNTESHLSNIRPKRASLF